MPAISLLMANFNNGRYLPEAVASLQAQSCRDWELIIVDDASTDDSWQIVQRVAAADDRIRIFRNPDNLKVGATKRRCASLAKGAICGILDPDDALAEDALESMVRAHAVHTDAALISSSSWLCDEFLNKQSLAVLPRALPEGKSYLESQPGSIQAFWSFKKSFYDQTEGFSENYILAEDQDLFYKLEEVGQVFFVDAPLYLYRIHDAGLSTGDKTASAFSWHIDAMADALVRRRRMAGRSALTACEQRAVAGQIRSFLDWGITRIDPFRALCHLTLLVRLAPGTVTDRMVLRSLWRVMKGWAGAAGRAS